jgi:AraC-like DNA-binding protein
MLPGFYNFVGREIMINYYELLTNNPAFYKQFSCKELLFLNYDCPVKAKKVAKWSEHNYIYYVISGKKTLHTPGNSWVLSNGNTVFIKKGACIVEQFFHEPFCIVVFIMPDSFIRNFMNENNNMSRNVIQEQAAEKLVIPIEADEVMRAFYESVMPYFSSESNPPENLIELKFKELLHHILRNPANKELIAYMQSLVKRTESPLEQVMEMNYAYNLQLEAYARLANRSLSSFKRDFQEIYHITPGRWLLQKRLDYACMLLTTTDNTVSDITLESGFENIAHFSRAFKQKFGASPLQYRKLHESHIVGA